MGKLYSLTKTNQVILAWVKDKFLVCMLVFGFLSRFHSKFRNMSVIQQETLKQKNNDLFLNF